MNRVAKTIELMDALAKINDHQCDLLLLRSCTGISKLYFSMRTCSPHIFESAQRSFDVALHSSLKLIVTTSGPGLGDWKWRLATLPFSFRGLGVYSATSKPNFHDALRVFNTSMETDFLSNPSIPLFSVLKPCLACSRVFAGDIYGDHFVLSAGIIGIKHRHNIVRDTLVDICYRFGISAGKEVDIRLDGGRDKPLRLADMLLYSWDEGLDVCVDLIGFSPLTQTRMVDFVPGWVVIDVAQRICGKYMDKCAAIGYGFLLFSFSSLGELEPDAVILLKRIRKFSMTQDIGTRATINIFNRTGFSIAKGEDPQSRFAGVFPPNIARPLHGIKLHGGPASVVFDFCSELVMKRVAKTIELMDAIARINDPQCDVLNYAFLASRLESAGLQTKLLRHTGIVAFEPIFDDALCVFNTSMEIDLLSNPSEIVALKLMKKMADIYFTRVTK
ncbi:hypothetical protein Tco_1427225, partial [Tanacetum coccineum]